MRVAGALAEMCERSPPPKETADGLREASWPSVVTWCGGSRLRVQADRQAGMLGGYKYYCRDPQQQAVGDILEKAYLHLERVPVVHDVATPS